jgi:hypothetical protein
MGTSAPAAHSRHLADAARERLEPLGVRRRGRSRVWLDDHAWWLVVVEFQPSSWAKGSYLNVGAMWLWGEKDHFSFDEGHRVEDFATFKDPKQFAEAAARMAERAATELQRYRGLFGSVGDVADFLVRKRDKGFWQTFDAAIACALAGLGREADGFFAEVAKEDEDRRDWVIEARQSARRLRTLAQDRTAFRDAMAEMIKRTRARLKLPEVPLSF